MMKWIKTGALASLFALITFAAQANTTDNSPMRLLSKVMPDQTLRIQLVNLQQQTATVELTDMNGKTLHRDLIKNHNGYARIYDLKEVEDGRYLLTAKQGNDEVIVVVRIKDGTIMTSDKARK
jgi:glucose/arabinose dehydrogenase